MQKLFTILTDSLMIWSRNFTLIYVFLLAWVVVVWFIPQSEVPTLELRWMLLFGVLFLWFSAMMAGMYSMIALACDRFLGRPRDQALNQVSPLDAFTLFKAFLPGVSRFMLPVAGGYLIQIGMAFLLLWPVQSLLTKYAPLLQKMSLVTAQERLKLMLALPVAQQDDFLQMTLMLFGALLVYALFCLMTILWPAFVIYYRNNPLKACFRSMGQCFKNPLGMIGLCAVIVGIRIPLGLLNSIGASSGNFLFSALVPLLDLFAEIFIAIVAFVYVYQTVGKPLPEPEEPKVSKSDDSNKDDIEDRFG